MTQKISNKRSVSCNCCEKIYNCCLQTKLSTFLCNLWFIILNLIAICSYLTFVISKYATNKEIFNGHSYIFEWIAAISVILYLIPMSFLFACHPSYHLPCQRYDDFETEQLSYPLDSFRIPM